MHTRKMIFLKKKLKRAEGMKKYENKKCAPTVTPDRHTRRVSDPSTRPIPLQPFRRASLNCLTEMKLNHAGLEENSAQDSIGILPPHPHSQIMEGIARRKSLFLSAWPTRISWIDRHCSLYFSVTVFAHPAVRKSRGLWQERSGMVLKRTGRYIGESCKKGRDEECPTKRSESKSSFRTDRPAPTGSATDGGSIAMSMVIFPLIHLDQPSRTGMRTIRRRFSVL